MKQPTVVSPAQPAPASFGRGALAALILLGVAAVALPPFASGATAAGTDRCTAPEALTALAAPLPHTAERLAEGKTLTIVALGSSSTYGTGASKPENSYPSRLAALLQTRFPATRIRVLNRGVGGELGAGTEQRIARDVLADKPDLVIWQVGTNDVLADLDPRSLVAKVRAGVFEMRRAGADVMLMDLQYAPAVLAHPRYREMERALRATAAAAGVPMFHRFALMQDWAERRQMTMAAMISRDRLHMTDQSYDCLARQLSASILRDTHSRG